MMKITNDIYYKKTKNTLLNKIIKNIQLFIMKIKMEILKRSFSNKIFLHYFGIKNRELFLVIK